MQLKEDEQRKLINTIKGIIQKCLSPDKKLDKLKMYKVNSKNADNMAFIVVPFNLAGATPRLDFRITWAT